MLWAENGAGRSGNVTYSEQCITDFAQPDAVDPPASLPQNGTTFGLTFSSEPDEINGPVALVTFSFLLLGSECLSSLFGLVEAFPVDCQLSITLCVT